MDGVDSSHGDGPDITQDRHVSHLRGNGRTGVEDNDDGRDHGSQLAYDDDHQELPQCLGAAYFSQLGQALDNNQGPEDDADKTKQEQDFNRGKIDLMNNNPSDNNMTLADIEEKGL